MVFDFVSANSFVFCTLPKQIVLRIKKFFRSQSYQTLIPLFFQFSLLSLAISKYIKYFLMPQTLKPNNEKQKKIFILQWKKFGWIDSRFYPFLQFILKFGEDSYSHVYGQQCRKPWANLTKSKCHLQSVSFH
jgi:hypothetical protein